MCHFLTHGRIYSKMLSEILLISEYTLNCLTWFLPPNSAQLRISMKSICNASFKAFNSQVTFVKGGNYQDHLCSIVSERYCLWGQNPMVTLISVWKLSGSCWKNHWRIAKVLRPILPTGRPGWNSWVLAFVLPSSDPYTHLRSELVDRFLSTSLPL